MFVERIKGVIICKLCMHKYMKEKKEEQKKKKRVTILSL